MIDLLTNAGIDYVFEIPDCYPSFACLAQKNKHTFTFANWTRIDSLTVPYADQAMVDDFISMGGSIDKKITEPQYIKYIQQSILEKQQNYQQKQLKFSEKENLRVKKEQTERLFEDNSLIVIKPLTYESMVIYGYQTKWCVSSNCTDEHYNNYACHSDMFVLINKDMNSPYKKIVLVLFKSGKFCLFDSEGCIINDAKILDISGKVTDSNRLGKIEHIFTSQVIDLLYNNSSIYTK